MIFEEETLIGMRAFPETQDAWAAEPAVMLPGIKTVGWYGSDVRPEEPAFCVVNTGASDDVLDLVGEIVQISRVGEYVRTATPIYLYCLGTADLPFDIAVSRRAFIELGRLSEEGIGCQVATT